MDGMNELKEILSSFDGVFRDYEKIKEKVVTALTAIISSCLDHELHRLDIRIDILGHEKVLCFDETSVVVSLFYTKPEGIELFLTFKELEAINKAFNGITMFILASADAIKIEMYLDALCGIFGIGNDWL